MRLIMLFSALVLSACGFETVDTGRRGVKVTFGEVVGEALPEGFYTYNPFTTDIIQMPVQEQAIEGRTACFTKDTQSVTVEYVATYYPEPSQIHNVYKQFGMDWEDKVIRPAMLGSMKDAVGQYIADDLVSKREAVKQAVVKELTEALKARHVHVTRLDLTNLDFDDAYEKAVEAKVVATQKAAEAKNRTIEVEEKAKQKIISAKADAESMRIRSEALSKNQNLVEYEAVQKWDGVLPQYIMGGGTPFINLPVNVKQGG